MFEKDEEGVNMCSEKSLGEEDDIGEVSGCVKK